MIILYGKLRKKFGKFIECNVNSINELMKAADALRPGLRNYIEADREYVIRRGNSLKKGKDVSEEEIEMKFSDNIWHLLPLPKGYKNGLFTAVLGAVIAVVGLYTGQGWMVNIGVGLMLAGVSSMLAPVPPSGDYSKREDPDKKPSYLFNGPLNRTESGGAVPLVYGKDVFIGSIFTSGGIEIGDVA